MSDIFVSYATQDRARVVPIVAVLEKGGWSVFWDHKLPAGKKWEDVLRVELKHARCVVVLWSRNSIKSPWVQLEASVARYRQILVPVLLDGDLQVDSDIPALFREIQAAKLVALTDPLNADFAPLLASVSQVLSKRKKALRLGSIAAGCIAFAFLSLAAARPVEVLRVASRTGLKRIAHGKYDTSENQRLGQCIRNAKEIKLLLPNANSFTQVFDSDLKAFFSKPGTSMQVIFATPRSEFYREMTQMTYGEDWNEQKKSQAYKANMARVELSREILKSQAQGNDKIEFRYFNTQFRVPLIIVDKRFCFLTVRLPPDDGQESLRLEFEGGPDPYAEQCVVHFEKLWNLSSLTSGN